MNKFPHCGLLAGAVGWLASLFMAGCQTTGRISPVPEKDSVVLYTTGQLLDLQPRRYVAAYWEQTKLHRLELGSALETGCYGLQKQGSDLYIAGYFVDPADERVKPCYWLNGHKIDLPIPPTLAFNKAGVRDLRFYQGSLYLLGDIDLQPVLWKIQTGSAPKLLFLKGFPQAVEGGELSTGNLAVYRDRLYIGGVQTLETDSQTVIHPGFWTVDKRDSIRFEEIDNRPITSLSFFILPTDRGVFIAGELKDVRDRSAPTPTIWKNSSRFQLSQSVNPVSQRLHEMETDSKGQLYLTILDYQRFLPIIWRVGLWGEVTETLLSVPKGATRAFCNNLALFNDTPYYSGTYELRGKYYACSWNGNQRTELETVDGGFLTLSRMIAVSAK